MDLAQILLQERIAFSFENVPFWIIKKNRGGISGLNSHQNRIIGGIAIEQIQKDPGLVLTGFAY